MREQLDALTEAGKRSARTNTRAHILRLADPGEGHRTVERVGERFVTGGLDAALAHTKPASPPRERVLGRAAEARLIALACSSTPAGRTACLYEPFDPTRVRRIAERLEWHYTAKHGSWLNMAEIEFAALSKQCLRRRIGSMSWLHCEFAGWEKEWE